MIAARNSIGRARRGIAAVELTMALPLILTVFLGIVEFATLMMAQQSLVHATYLGARRASVVNATPSEIERTVRSALSARMGQRVTVEVQGGSDSGDLVFVRAFVPMQCAAPDLLAWVGVSLWGRELSAGTMLHRE